LLQEDGYKTDYAT
jgi:hypothetical protein